MNRGEQLITKHKVKVAGLLFVIILSSGILILTNYASLKITSAVRSYINGESQYSKAQKDASTNLLIYLNTADTSYYTLFKRELKVPIGDSIARTGMIVNGNPAEIRKGLIQGRNNEEDLDEMIWLFKNFQEVSFMREAIFIWKQADAIIAQLAHIGEEINSRLTVGSLDESEKVNWINEINEKSNKLTSLERAFSDSLRTAARNINTYLFYANMIMTILLIGAITTYILLVIRRLRKANVELIIINQELDKFVYSASHDLRAPISSIKGLISLVSTEQDRLKIQHYLKLMTFTLNKQDQFIREIIDFSRNKKTKIEQLQVSLDSIISHAILQHQHMPGACRVEVKKDIKIDIIESDPLRLEIIFKNIISNAFKYNDPSKEQQYVNIKTFKSGSDAVITVEDNGIGIEEKYLSQVFEMFFVTDHNQNGSGLGLYLTKETVSKLDGTINVTSQKGAGSTFTVRIPAGRI